VTPAGGPQAPLAAELDALYGAPLEQFIQRRDELAKRLKGAGEAEAARRVKALRKPTAVAWAINRLHLGSDPPGGLAALESASAALRAALRDPRSVEERRSAIDARRRALESTAAAAVALLAESGAAIGPALERRVERTLLAIAAGGSGTAGERPLPGRLDRELEPPGFEAAGDLPAQTPALPSPPPPSPAAAPRPAAVPPPATATRAAPAPAAGAAASRSQPARAAGMGNERREREEAADAAQAALDDAEADLERSTLAVEAARARVADAERALAAARAEADAARRALAAARAHRDRLRRAPSSAPTAS